MTSPPAKETDPRMHTAEHILSGTMVKVHGTARPFTTHLEKRKSKVDFHFPRALTDAELKDLEERVNGVIRANLRVHEEYIGRSAAAEQYDLRRLPEHTGDTIRLIHVGDYDTCPCNGNHVRITGDIGSLRIISASHEDGALRIRFTLTLPGPDRADTA